MLEEHCVKSVSEFSGPCFTALGMNTEIYSVHFPVQSECGEIHTRKTPNRRHFLRSGRFYCKTLERELCFSCCKMNAGLNFNKLTFDKHAHKKQDHFLMEKVFMETNKVVVFRIRTFV